MLNVTLRQLKIFQAAASHLNFARAAHDLHLTQPAVSMQIRQLEESLGFDLFERIGRRVALTQAGVSMYRSSLDVSSHMAEFEWLAQQHTAAETGGLQIAALTTADYVLPQVVAAYLQDKPKVSVSLRTGNGPMVHRFLRENLVDFALTGAMDDAEGIVLQPLMEQAFVVVAPVAMSAPNQPVALRYLETRPLIMREQTSPSRAGTENFLAQHGVKPYVRMSLASDEAVKAAVRAGAGIAVMPLLTVQLELKHKYLQLIQVRGFPLWRPLFISTRSGKHLTSIAEGFKTYLSSELPSINRALIERLLPKPY